ncbi:MAG: RluA family pseudouridine synthase [Planctomycetota bacterium]
MAVLTIEPNKRITFSIKHEDADILVVEKPTGVVTLPGVGHEHDTLLNGLFATHGERLQQLGRSRDFGLVHRLDRDTSGLLIIALSVNAYEGLQLAFRERQVKKYYWALSHKSPRDPEGVIKRPVIEYVKRRDRYSTEKLARVDRAGKPAVTAYRVLEANDLGALIEARAVTGRLHQVRVHLASVGAALVGDKQYAPRLAAGGHSRVALHAHRVVFEHPVTDERIDVRSGVPKDLRKVLNRLDLELPT